MTKNGRKVRNVGKVPNAVSITKRPRYIEKRVQVGHWETDDMEGTKSSKAALSVSRERALCPKSGTLLLIIFWLSTKNSKNKVFSIITEKLRF